MDQIKTGKFIAACRKEKRLTQAQLAEIMSVSDRAVSKWETGRSMPDSSIMLVLSETLGINVNELLTGERIPMEEYKKAAEDNLLRMKKQEEAMNKRLLNVEVVIGVICTVVLLLLILTALYAVENTLWKIILVTVGVLVFIIGVGFCLRIEQYAGYYECGKCQHRHIPAMSPIIFAMHVGRTRYMKCPECNEWSWQHKKLVK